MSLNSVHLSPSIQRLCAVCVLLKCFIYVSSVLFLLNFHARLFIDALWSPVGKGLVFWLSLVMSNCEVVTLPLVSWFRCGAWLYRSLIFVLFLTLSWVMLPLQMKELAVSQLVKQCNTEKSRKQIRLFHFIDSRSFYDQSTYLRM